MCVCERETERERDREKWGRGGGGGGGRRDGEMGRGTIPNTALSTPEYDVYKIK